MESTKIMQRVRLVQEVLQVFEMWLAASVLREDQSEEQERQDERDEDLIDGHLGWGSVSEAVGAGIQHVALSERRHSVHHTGLNTCQSTKYP